MSTTNETKARDRARKLVAGLLGELEAVCGNADVLAMIGDVMAGRATMNAAQIDGQINATWQQVTSLPSRIDSLHKLAETMRTLGMIERTD